jgi:hypothetical protein
LIEITGQTTVYSPAGIKGSDSLIFYSQVVFMFDIFGKRKPKTRSAGIYQYPDSLIVHAQHKSTAGVSLAALPVMHIPVTATSEDIGQALRRVLDSYREGVAHPTDWKGFGKEFLQEAGFRSWQALMKSAKSCWIEEASGQITFTPLRNGGGKDKERGFGPFGAELIVVASGCTDAELGAALVRTLRISE